MTLSEELQWRGFVNQTTLPNISDLNDKRWVFYHGYDASADSLTVGNLAAIMLDKCFIRHGNKAIILAGGATSLIGDPGGKDAERPLQSAEQIAANVAAVRAQIEGLFGHEISMVNNLDWFNGMTVLEFLRDVGKHFSMTPLVQRDYIAKRIGEGGQGISYTEFSYTLLQGYDFLHLFREHGTTLQVAGSDQWGNALSGVELVRRVEGKEVHTLTCPLIINKATGKKFGKSEDGAVWLDKSKTSVYKFYQFWLNVDDEGAEGYLKIFTELDKQAIDEVVAVFEQNRGGRLVQKTLAYEVTKMVHGKQAADQQKAIAEVLFENADYAALNKDDFDDLIQELPSASISGPLEEEAFIQALIDTGLAASKTEARRFLGEGAIYLNGAKVTGDISALQFGSQNAVIIRRGKNKNAVLKITA